MGKRSGRCLVCVSVDGLCSEDRAYIERLPHFGRLLGEGAAVGRVQGIYPTQTYPLHTTVVTGAFPLAHGISANTLFQPGRESPDWHWFRCGVRVPTLYDQARRAGMRVGLLLWPAAGGSAPGVPRAQYLLPEIQARPGRSQLWPVLRHGTPRFLLEVLLRYGRLLRGIERRHLDDFVAASAAHLIRIRRPHLLLVHLLDLDHQRHAHGASSPQAFSALGEEDGRLGQIMAALEEAGIRGQTTLAVVGDHGLIDVHHRINVNGLFLENGLLERDGAGRLVSWRAWANACEGSAQVLLADREDAALRRRVEDLLGGLARDPAGGVQAVFDREEARRMGVGDLDFILEARPGFYFSPRVRQPLVEPAEGIRATHGYHPENGRYHSFFAAWGRGVRAGARLDSARLVDIGPTLAELLGLRLPAAEGRVLREILE